MEETKIFLTLGGHTANFKGIMENDLSSLTQHSDPHGVMRILTIDDDPDIGMAITDLLKQEGYAVTAVESGKTAIDLCERQQYQAVILDLGLPDRDGSEVLTHMLACDPLLPVIILTAYSPLERYPTKIEQGRAFAFLSKPFDRKKLKDTVRRAVQSRVQVGMDLKPA